MDSEILIFEDYGNNDFVPEIVFQPITASSVSILHSDSPVVKKPRVNQKSYRKKVETAWSHESILKLVQEVEWRRSLWDAGCAKYKLHKDALWQEVADSIPVTLNDCKGKWSNLRTTFNCNLEKLRKKRSGQGTDETVNITWKYFKPLMFLETHKLRQSAQSTSSMQLESATADESVVNDLGFSEELASLSPSVSGQRRVRKNSTPKSLSSTMSCSRDTPNLKEMAVEALQSLRSKNSQPKDMRRAFGEYIAAEWRSLTPEQSAFARSKLRRAYNDIMDKASLIVTQQPKASPNDVTNEGKLV